MTDAAATDAAPPGPPAAGPPADGAPAGDAGPDRLAAVWGRVVGVPGLRPAFGLVLMAAALWALHREFRTLSLAEVRASFRSIPPTAVAAAGLLTALNYLVLIGYDWLAVKLVDKPVPFRRVAAASLLSYAFSNSLGVWLGGTPVRAKLYTAWGLTPAEVARLILFVGLAFWVGLFALAGSAFAFAPLELPATLRLPVSDTGPLGWAMLAAVGAWFVLCAVRRTPLHVLGVNVQPPPVRVAAAQTVVAALDFALAAGTLFVLLPADAGVSFGPFLGVFLLAIVAALVSHVPGGVGVFELVIVALLSVAERAGVQDDA